MKLDVLIFNAHPDDAEAAMGGTILKFISQGKKVGIVDMTQGELSTRGTTEGRVEEAAEADRRLGISIRVNLGFQDGWFRNDEAHVRDVVQVIRRFQPDIIFGNPDHDRHPDHPRASALLREAIFFSGLQKVETMQDDVIQKVWRPKRLYHYIQAYEQKPDFIVDITPFWERKRHAMLAYASQFHHEDACKVSMATPISDPGFWSYWEGRARTIGRHIGVEMGEGFVSPLPLQVEDLGNLAL